jgi:hypothetical protein
MPTGDTFSTSRRTSSRDVLGKIAWGNNFHESFRLFLAEGPLTGGRLRRLNLYRTPLSPYLQFTRKNLCEELSLPRDCHDVVYCVWRTRNVARGGSAGLAYHLERRASISGKIHLDFGGAVNKRIRKGLSSRWSVVDVLFPTGNLGNTIGQFCYYPQLRVTFCSASISPKRLAPPLYSPADAEYYWFFLSSNRIECRTSISIDNRRCAPHTEQCSVCRLRISCDGRLRERSAFWTRNSAFESSVANT